MMNSETQQAPSFNRDLFSLAKAPMGELLEAIKGPEMLAHEGGAVPALSVQIAGLIVAEAVRLIRLGTRSELAEAADELAEALIDPPLSNLKRDQPEAHRQLSAASVMLGAAVAPSSSGGEMAVLRSWSGNAKKALALINEEQGQAMERARLREHLKIKESHLSHLLADLEAAGLVTKVKRGKTVTVHLGRTAREEHVQREISRHYFPPIVSVGVEEGGSRLLGSWPTRIERGRGDQTCNERILDRLPRDNSEDTLVPAGFTYTNFELRKRADNIVKSSAADRRPDTPRLAAGRRRR